MRNNSNKNIENAVVKTIWNPNEMHRMIQESDFESSYKHIRVI